MVELAIRLLDRCFTRLSGIVRQANRPKESMIEQPYIAHAALGPKIIAQLAYAREWGAKFIVPIFTAEVLN
jgi:hypothetical protein